MTEIIYVDGVETRYLVDLNGDLSCVLAACGADGNLTALLHSRHRARLHPCMYPLILHQMQYDENKANRRKVHVMLLASTRLFTSTLSRRREELHLTQLSVAKAIGSITTQAVSNWEQGISIPTDAHLVQLSQILQLDVEILRKMAREAKSELGYETPATRQVDTKNRTQAMKDTESENVLSSLIKGIKGLFG